MSIRLLKIMLIGLCTIYLTACNHNNPAPTSTISPEMTIEPTITSQQPTQTPLLPTPTPIPLAVLVNGEAITLDEFTGELARLSAAMPITGTILASDPGAIVLDDLINQTLLAQSASQNGFIVDETMLNSRINALETQIGGSQMLTEWITTQGYSNEDFNKALKRSIEAAWMRDEIIAAVSETADQVHVRQILLPTTGEADEVYASLQSGTDFIELASQYAPITGGDLGWFPRGYLDEPAIEDAAFALQPGQYSLVIETEIGYHILYLVERDENRSLLPAARKVLQSKALYDWISERRNQSDIQILLP
jgi:peptidyl-prolyl cis-trans isomerase C